jgi:hypothetical protein
MPMTYTIDSARSLVTAVGTGTLTDDDVLAHRQVLTSDPQFSQTMRELSDLRQVTDFRVTVACIRAMVAADVKTVSAGGMHKLAVVTDNDVAYGMSRMYQALDDPHIRSVGVFRTYEEAAAWLGIE